jgi:excisionase family DNA binding protein
MSERLENVKQVAERLGVSEKFVRRHSLEMGGFKLGSHLRFRPTLVDSYVDARSLDPSRRSGKVVKRLRATG